MASPSRDDDEIVRSELHCSLKKCSHGQLGGDGARVEVKSFDVNDKEKVKMQVTWECDGQAVFHKICWKELLKSLDTGKPYQLCQGEKDMIKEAKKTAEYFDSWEAVKSEARRAAHMLTTAKYAIAFTGAGISTSAGIGDFRGKAGKWTERDRKKIRGTSAKKTAAKGKAKMYASLRPTYTHEAIKKLMDMGLLKFVISQNVDGLHRLSGIPRDSIAELHGNCFHEKCEKCKTRYERAYSVRGNRGDAAPPRKCPTCRLDHRSGRLCTAKGCDGCLMNTIINFGDNLETRVLSAAEDNAMKNDLVLCLGTSLTVTPACDMVEMGTQPPRLIICNRQTTPFDAACYERLSADHDSLGSRSFTDCDTLMREIMKCILPGDEFEHWEGGRETRLREYAQQREECPDISKLKLQSDSKPKKVITKATTPVKPKSSEGAKPKLKPVKSSKADTSQASQNIQRKLGNIAKEVSEMYSGLD